MFNFGAGELFLIFAIALLFLGPKKLPELAKALGKSIREFNRARFDIEESEVKKETKVASTDVEHATVAASEKVEKEEDKLH